MIDLILVDRQAEVPMGCGLPVRVRVVRPLTIVVSATNMSLQTVATSKPNIVPEPVKRRPTRIGSLTSDAPGCTLCERDTSFTELAVPGRRKERERAGI